MQHQDRPKTTFYSGCCTSYKWRGTPALPFPVNVRIFLLQPHAYSKVNYISVPQQKFPRDVFRQSEVALSRLFDKLTNHSMTDVVQWFVKVIPVLLHSLAVHYCANVTLYWALQGDFLFTGRSKCRVSNGSAALQLGKVQCRAEGCFPTRGFRLTAL